MLFNTRKARELVRLKSHLKVRKLPKKGVVQVVLNLNRLNQALKSRKEVVVNQLVRSLIRISHLMIKRLLILINSQKKGKLIRAPKIKIIKKEVIRKMIRRRTKKWTRKKMTNKKSPKRKKLPHNRKIPSHLRPRSLQGERVLSRLELVTRRELLILL
jgi:hypothetical protein